MATTTTKKEKAYTPAIGRRKTSTAQVRLSPAEKTSVIVNERPVAEYFPTSELFKTAMGALHTTENVAEYAVTVKVSGGGIHSQAESVRHGIARALVKIDEAAKTDLKKAGFLKRDSRSKERRKFGLKKARKAAQWSKR
jgi:small subunit ribosomal protein S9